jgi:hypothetical protein
MRMDMPAYPRLSKTRFLAGVRCPKSLWLECHAPQVADPVDETRQALFDQGHQVGALARERYGGGVLVAEDHLHSAQALETTRRLLAEGVDCLYEGAFWHDGVLVRADILFRDAADGWTLLEVKSSSSVKPEHLPDLAVQVYVLRGAGLPVTAAGLLYLNKDYLYLGGPYDLGELFVEQDLTDEVEGFLPAIPGLLEGMRRVLAGPLPEIPVGRRCLEPYDCRFLGYCHQSLPEYPVTELPRVSAELLDSLIANGYYSMRDVPLDYPGLTDKQRTVCFLARSGEVRFGAGLGEALEPLREPVHFLDFETFGPALPLYPRTKPYQHVPVQWSCHTLDDGLRHAEFLHTDASDPRRPFAESLLEALKGEGPVVVYTGFEGRIIESLVVELPDLADRLTALQARLFDLERVVREHVQHPAFRGRSSLKYVLPALVPDLSYQGLAIPNGEVATLRWAQAVYGEVDEPERQQIFADLRAYCATDTLGLVRIVDELRAHCG